MRSQTRSILIAYSVPRYKFSFRLISLLLIAGLASVPMIAVLVAMVGADMALWLRLWDTTLPTYLVNTASLMVLTGIISFIIGVGAAWCVTMLVFPGRRALSWLLILPLAAPAYIIAYYYTDLLEFYGPVQSGLRGVFGWDRADYTFPAIRTLPGAALMLALVLYPYVYLLARAAFQKQSSGQWHAARSLGLSPWQSFYRVALPSARPAIAGGLALVLMETLADFGVADYFAIQTFSTGIFRNWLAGGDRDAAMMLAGVMLLFVFALVLLEASSRKGRVETRGRTRAQDARIVLSPVRAWLVTAFCSLPVIFGFLIPFAGLAINTVSVGDGQSREFWRYTINSLLIAIFVAIIAVILAIALGYAQRSQKRFVFRSSLRLATLGYALPGALLAVGLLAPLGLMDRALTRWAAEAWGWDGGLILTGTIIALVYALVVRFLTVSFNSVVGGFDKVTHSMDHAARSLGMRPAQLIARIHVPLMRSSIAAGGMLVFIDVMRELPATLILRPFNFDTLATRVYWLASDERLAEASSAALLIILIGLIPVAIVTLSLFRSD